MDRKAAPPQRVLEMLGLYLAKRIAELHGGDLSAESPPGKGARFILSLPAAPESA